MIERSRRWEDNAMDMKLSPGQLKLRSAARELAETEFAPKAAEIDRTEAYPFDNVAALKAAGFMGYTIPESYGGRGGKLLRGRPDHRGNGACMRGDGAH